MLLPSVLRVSRNRQGAVWTTAARPLYDQPMTARATEGVLAEIISTVNSSLDLDEVLGAVVRLLSEGSAVHACFVYLLDEEGGALVLAAASPPYAHLIGEVRLERGEGLAWWAAERMEPAFIRDELLADPRVKYVPELEEERFQSLLCVPILSRGGDAIGVVSAHTEAPREFTQGEVDFLVSSASLVAGAIENARLYTETRTRLGELEQLTGLAEAIAQAASLDELLGEVSGRGLELLRARACRLYLLEPGSEELVVHSTAGADGGRERIGLSELGPELARGGRASRVAVPLVAGDELVGLLVGEETAAVDLARAVASQAAVGVRKLQLIERLTEKNLIKDFFEDVAAGRLGPELEGRAARLRLDPGASHVVLAAEPASDALESALTVALPGSLFDRRQESLRALLRVPPGAAERGADRVGDAVRRAHAKLPVPLPIGLSSASTGLSSLPGAFAEASQALLGAAVLRGDAAVLEFEELGPYKYLLRLAQESSARDATIEAVARLAAYDRDRGASLLKTLEEFLHRRGSISATADALYVHPNTLRQRLRRIGELSGLDLRREDWLMVEIAVKLVRLRLALGRADPHIAPA